MTIFCTAWIYAIYEAKIETLDSLEGIATGGIIIRLICHLIARDGGITGFN